MINLLYLHPMVHIIQNGCRQTDIHKRINQIRKCSQLFCFHVRWRGPTKRCGVIERHLEQLNQYTFLIYCSSTKKTYQYMFVYINKFTYKCYRLCRVHICYLQPYTYNVRPIVYICRTVRPFVHRVVHIWEQFMNIHLVMLWYLFGPSFDLSIVSFEICVINI